MKEVAMAAMTPEKVMMMVSDDNDDVNINFVGTPDGDSDQKQNKSVLFSCNSIIMVTYSQKLMVRFRRRCCLCYYCLTPQVSQQKQPNVAVSSSIVLLINSIHQNYHCYSLAESYTLQSNQHWLY